MATGTSRFFAPAGSGGRPAAAGRSNRLRKCLGTAALLSLSVFFACSGEIPAHVGDWSGQLYYKDFSNPEDIRFLFHSDGRVEYRRITSGGTVESREGTYRIRYDQFPSRLYIEFRDGTTLNGLVNYFGREKTVMHVGVVPVGPPSHLSETDRYYFLEKRSERRAVPE